MLTCKVIIALFLETLCDRGTLKFFFPKSIDCMGLKNCAQQGKFKFIGRTVSVIQMRS